MKYNFSRRYREDNGRVIKDDELHTISIGSLEGSFDEVIQKLQEEKERYQPNKEIFCYDTESYERSYGEKALSYIYERIFLEDSGSHSEYRELQVRGERIVIGEELEAYMKWRQEEKEKNMQYQREQYEKLKKQFEG